MDGRVQKLWWIGGCGFRWKPAETRGFRFFIPSMKKRTRGVWMCWAGLALALSAARAQDATVSPPAWWSEAAAAGEQPPVLKSKVRVEVPDAVKKMAEPGYVLKLLTIDAKGNAGVSWVWTPNSYLLDAVSEGLSKAKYEAATKGGAPVGSFSWLAVIFNPASAGEKGPEATPRLLAVTPVVVPRKLAGKAGPNDLPTVWATLQLDEKGAVTEMTPEAPEHELYRPAIEEALKRWKFAPARKDGVAVAGKVRVPILLQIPLPKKTTKENYQPPRAVKQEQPPYPRAMKYLGYKGRVRLSFQVGVDGKVSDVVVLQSNNPGFDQPAYETIQKWVFEPAKRDGKPVATKMQIDLVFALPGMPDDGNEVATVRQNRKTPEALKVDVVAHPRGIARAVYPYELLKAKKKGKASAVIMVGEDGKVWMTKVAEATDPAFGMALQAACDMFSFDPAVKDGKPVMAYVKNEQEFSPGGDLVSSDDAAMLRLEEKHPERIVGADKLDTALRPISQRAPVFPGTLKETAKKGEAMVEFLVDEKGAVRLPRVVSASAPEFGYAAVQALAAWRFDPPKAGGKGAVVRVRVPFKFKLEESALERSRDVRK